MSNTKKILPRLAPEIVERMLNMASLELHKIKKNKMRENGYVNLNQE